MHGEYNDDTIISLATAFGKSAIAVIRVSGNNLSELIVQSTKMRLKSRIATYSNLYSPIDGSMLDECVVTYFKTPNSFTGEDVLEISCHGSTSIIKSILNAYIKFGVRQALPGEFSYRAYINGKIDLVQAEAVADLINSKTGLGSKLSLNNLKGAVSQNIINARKSIFELLTIIEHELDFSEDEISFERQENISKKIEVINTEFVDVLKSANHGKLIFDGFRVALLGVPNSGKSTIFNRLIGMNRAIVSEIPGTTRDTIEVWFELNSIPVCLVDTAGYHETENKIDTIGVEKTIQEFHAADLVLFIDELNPIREFEESFSFDSKVPVVFIQSKCDMKKKFITGALQCSNVDNFGFNKILNSIEEHVSAILTRSDFPNESIVNKRQSQILEKVTLQFTNIQEEIENGADTVILSSLLRDALDTLAFVTGETSNQEILENIFKNFCVGK